MVSFPFKVFLFVAGGSAAALGTAFVTGAFDPMKPVALANLPAAETAAGGGVSAQGSDSVALAAVTGASAPEAAASTETRIAMIAPPPPESTSGDDGAPSRSADTIGPNARGLNAAGASAAPVPVSPDETPLGSASKESSLAENGVDSAAAETPSTVDMAPLGGTAASVLLIEPMPRAGAKADPERDIIALTEPNAGAAMPPAALSDLPSPVPAAAGRVPPLQAASGPVFDVLRVEGDGSVVLAGKATGGSQVDIVDGDRVLGSTTAGPDGDFAFVLDDPLAPGSHQLTLRETGLNGKATVSPQSAILSIPQNRSGQVLAMLEQPGQASRFLTLPQAAVSAVAPSPAPSASRDPGTQLTVPEAAAKGDRSRTTSETPAGQAAAEALAAGETASAAVSAGQSAAAPPKGSQSAVDQNAAQQAELDAVIPGGKTVAARAQAVAVDAVEIEGRKIFVAGAALPGQTVRVYAGEDYLGEAVGSPEGRFLVEGERDVAVGEYLIRADALDSKRNKVVARAAVPFQREPGENVAAMAEPVVALAQAQASAVDGSAGSAPASDSVQDLPPSAEETGTGSRFSTGSSSSAPPAGSSVMRQAPAAPSATETALLEPRAIPADPAASFAGVAQPQGQVPASESDAASAVADSPLPTSGSASAASAGRSALAPATVGSEAAGQGSSGSAAVANGVDAAAAANGRAASAQAPANGSRTPDGEAGQIASSGLEASTARVAPAKEAAAAKGVAGSSPAQLSVASADAASAPETSGDALASTLAAGMEGSNATAVGGGGEPANSNADESEPAGALADTATASQATSQSSGGTPTEAPVTEGTGEGSDGIPLSGPTATELAEKRAPGSRASDRPTAATASSAGRVSPAGSANAAAIASAEATGSSSAARKPGAEQNAEALDASTAKVAAQLPSGTEPLQGAAAERLAAIPSPSTDVASTSPLIGDTAANATHRQTLPVVAVPAVTDAQAAASGADLQATGKAEPNAGSSVAAGSAVPAVLAPKLRSVDSAVIIRRGDSLWRISKRVYGRGTRYSTIYLANNDQIQDPDRIWPGQIFSVPHKTSQGEAADLSKVAGQAMTIAQ